MAHTFFPSDIDNNYGNEANSEVKLHRQNIANEMWNSYLDYMADTEASNNDDNTLGLGE